MNKRISELARQAYMLDRAKTNSEYESSKLADTVLTDLDGFFQQFAKLIALECLEVIKNESMDSGDEWEDGLCMAQDAIKQQFDLERV